MVRYIFNHIVPSSVACMSSYLALHRCLLRKDTKVSFLRFFIVSMYLELLHIRTNIKLLSEVGPWLSVQIPVRIGNL
jgi:hypothetical protein